METKCVCECGCGTGIRENTRFVHNHHTRGKKRNPESVAKMLETLSKPEVKEKMKANIKASWTEERKAGHIEKRKGKKHSEEWRGNISAGNKGKVRTKEMREVYRQKNLGKRMGAENNLWKGGVSRAYKTGYYSPEYNAWRRQVFERDNYTCQHCGSNGGKYVTAHHIKSFAKFPELRFDVNNGITLCEPCHCKVDNYRARFIKNKNINN